VIDTRAMGYWIWSARQNCLTAWNPTIVTFAVLEKHRSHEIADFVPVVCGDPRRRA
jgi:hypothetical protein